MKKLVILLLIAGIALCGAGGLAESPEAITVVLDYVANTNHTGMYVALDLGYYLDEGLDVSIIEPMDGVTASLVSANVGQFGVSYQEDVTMARAAEDALPIRAIATLLQHNTSGFATAAEKNILSVSDFEGKTYAGWGGPGEEAVLKALMLDAGVDFNSLNVVISDGGGFESLKDRVDIMWFYEAWDNIKCRLNGFEINYIELRQLDERLDYYTPILITNEEMISEHPETIRRFLTATEQGYRYAIENPGEAAAILSKYATDSSMELLTDSQQYLAEKYMEDSETWGTMKAEVWDRYTEFLLEYSVIDKNIPADELFTNEFLPDGNQ